VARPSPQAQTERRDEDEEASDEGAPIIIQNLKPNEAKPPPNDEYASSPIMGSSPRKSWFSSFFASKEKEKQSTQASFGIHTAQSHDTVEKELNKCFEKLAIKAKYINPRYKAKFAKDKQVIKFSVEITQLEKGTFINFAQISGRPETYTALFSLIKKELSLRIFIL